MNRCHRPHRLSTRAFVLVVVLLLASAVALAGRMGEKRPEPAKEDGDAVFQLQSGLVAQIPAVKEAMAALRASPESPEAWQQLARALSEAGDREDAVRALEAAVEIAPDRAELWVDLGAALVQSGEINDAIDALGVALDIEPFLPLAHYNLGIAYQEDGRYDESLDAFERALTLAPELGDPKLNPGVVNNPDMPMVKLRIYMKTTGAAPSIYTGELAGRE